MTGEPGLRVLLTADALGGVWVYALDLARALVDQGCAVTLAVLGPPPSQGDRAEAAAVPGLRVVETGLPVDWLAPDIRTIKQAGRALAHLARDVGADVVHLNSPAFAADAGFSVPVVATAHSCLLTWWQAVKGAAPLPPEFRWQASLTQCGYGKVDLVLAPSRAFARATAAAYGLEVEPALVPNGRAAPTLRQDSLAETGPRSVFTAGRLWDEGKGVEVLDEAAGRIDLPVRAAGSTTGPNGAAIRLQHTECLGRLDPAEIARHLADGPIYAAPSLYEPFGLAVLEAAQHGCPLILSDIPTFRELWDDAALFVPVREPDRLAAAICAIAADPARAAALGASARTRAGRFTPSAMAKGTLAAYWQVLTDDGARLAS